MKVYDVVVGVQLFAVCDVVVRVELVGGDWAGGPWD
jgi:hypothetical protein